MRHQRDPRIDLEMPVELVCADSGEIFAGRSVNLSKSGMLIRSEAPKERGSLLRFEFRPQFHGMGEVIWTRSAENGAGVFLGIKFHSLEGASRMVLAGLLDETPA